MSAVRTSLQHKAIYVETRNFNDYSRWREAFEQAGFAYQPHLNFHVDCTDEEAMRNKLSDNRKRQIKKAIQNGSHVVEAQKEEEIIAWYAILKSLYRSKVKTPLFPLSFFLTFYRKKLGKFLLVKTNERVIGGMMCPILDGKCIYEWFVCGYGAMEYAHAHTIPIFDIMGAGKPDVPYGVRDFKAEFGGKLVEYGRFLKVQKPVLYGIGVMGVKMLKKI